MRNLIREGIVSSVDAQKATARVTFADRDGLVSAELPILQSACLKNKFYSLVDVGDCVVCLMTPNSDDGSGFILGAHYSDKAAPPVDNPNVTRIKFSDGTTISYNRAEHLLKIKSSGDLEIKCSGKIKLESEHLELKGGIVNLTGDVLINGRRPEWNS